jgi:glycosyltransferase involved in cell wall biosynthesis
MKVALIHHQYKLKGGMETYLFNLINGFIKQQDHVTAYVYKLNKRIPVLCDIQKTNLVWLPRVWRKFWFGAFCNTRRKGILSHDIRISLMRALNQDIMICGGTHQGLLTHINKKPGFLDRLEIAIERKSYHSSKIVIAHSNKVKQELIDEYGVPEEKIFMIYPPLDIDHFSLAETNKYLLRKKFNIHPDKTAILFPSTGHRRKGFNALVKAFALLPENKFELVVAGSNPSRYVSNINYVGFVTDMPALYRACDVTILPSYYEPFGLVVVESLHCGTPVIISKNVGAKELIAKEEGIIIDSYLPSAIADAILQSTEKKFAIRPDFANCLALTVDTHITALKNVVHHSI